MAVAGEIIEGVGGQARAKGSRRSLSGRYNRWTMQDWQLGRIRRVRGSWRVFSSMKVVIVEINGGLEGTSHHPGRRGGRLEVG